VGASALLYLVQLRYAPAPVVLPPRLVPFLDHLPPLLIAHHLQLSHLPAPSCFAHPLHHPHILPQHPPHTLLLVHLSGVLHHALHLSSSLPHRQHHLPLCPRRLHHLLLHLYTGHSHLHLLDVLQGRHHS